ncbi:MAG: ADP-ribosylglycohydrolase family protein, partial [Desulfobacterales bacterium]
GQAIGVLWGDGTESKWIGEMVPFDLEDWYRMKDPPKEFTDNAPHWRDLTAYKNHYLPYYNNKQNWEKWVPDKMADQDDLYVEFMFLYSIVKHGLDVTATEMAEDWVAYLAPNRVWGANGQAHQNFREGIWPPRSGHPHNTPYADAIDFQIESDLFGLINPGMPRISNAWCDKVGHMMNYGDGVYAGMAIAAMYGEAFFEKDPRKLAEYSLRAIPAESGYAKMVRDVLDLHQKNPDWRDTWRALDAKWGKKDGEPVMKLDVRINGANVYMGLLYGGGDFWKSMNIAMRGGWDSDCNPSNVAGILGTILGMNGIPEKWAILRDLPIENNSIKGAYPASMEWDDILGATVEAGKWNVLQHGGHVENGNLYIPFQMPTSPPLEQTVWQELPDAAEQEALKKK